MLAAAEAQLDGAGRRSCGDLQKRLEALEAARKEREDASWRGLVKLYETMKPRDAATIFNDLDLPVLLPVLDRMKEAKAAPVLAAMQPERARLVTANSPTAAPAPTPSRRPRPPPAPRRRRKAPAAAEQPEAAMR